MQAIEIAFLNRYEDCSVVLFTDEGIVLDAQTSSVILPFQSIQQLALTVHTAYLDHASLILKCHNTLNTQKMLEQGFVVHKPKNFLYQTTQKSIRALILRAIHCLGWDAKLQHCTQCGEKIQKIWHKTEKLCPNCRLSFFPHFSPAIMVLIQREHEILLARSRHFEEGMYSALAGFIDLGETAEMAAHREVKEEVGLEISHLEYFGTQPWPFPDSFMIAFKAQYSSGDLKIDPEEIEDAQWFTIDRLPKLPSNASIARALINSTIAQI